VGETHRHRLQNGVAITIDSPISSLGWRHAGKEAGGKEASTEHARHPLTRSKYYGRTHLPVLGQVLSTGADRCPDVFSLCESARNRSSKLKFKFRSTHEP
jgi:hypothetical protein